ncbi:MAG: hypothetical protein LBV44_03210 [Methylobacillus sp.]|jgi:hypothetical protein|nr:hypothetical protein [Methylobacillus sp.]
MMAAKFLSDRLARRGVTAAFLVMVVFLFANPAAAEDAPSASDVDRLTDLVMRAAPITAGIQKQLDSDSNWPFGEKTAKVNASQLQCIRQQLSPAALRENRRQAVVMFIKRHPDKVQDAIDVLTLDQEVEVTFGAVIQAGLESGGKETFTSIGVPNAGKKYDELAEQQQHKLISFMADDEYKTLRDLVLFGVDTQVFSHYSGYLAGREASRKIISDVVSYCSASSANISPVIELETQAPSSINVDRLTDLIVRAFPLGKMIQTMKDNDSSWPLMEKVSKVDASQLQCVRQQMSAEGLRESRRQAVGEFVKRHPEQAQDFINILNDGVADAMELVAGQTIQMMAASTPQEKWAKNLDLRKSMADVPDQQGAEVALVMTDAKYALLRKLMFYDGDDLTVGVVVIKKMLLSALTRCNVPLSSLK